MKRIYIAPTVEITKYEVRVSLLAASIANDSLNSMDYDSSHTGNEQMVKGDCIWDEE